MKKRKIIAAIMAVLVATILGLTTYFTVLNIVSKEDKEYVDNVNNYISENITNTETLTNIINQLDNADIKLVDYKLGKKNQQIAYNDETNKFVIINQFGGIIYPSHAQYKDASSIYKFVHKESEISDKFSSYLTKDFKESGDGVLNIATSLDVGFNEIKTINFKTKTKLNKVKLVTLNSVINITNNNSYFEHYGYADEINILKGSNIRFAEFGKTKFIDVYSANMSFKTGSKVDKLYVNKSESLPVLFFESGSSLTAIGLEEEMNLTSNKEIITVIMSKDKFKKAR